MEGNDTMTGFTKLVRLATAIGISVALGACGGSAKSPVAPSNGATPAAGLTTSISTGASIDGTVAGVSGAHTLGMRGMAAGPSVTVAGTNISSSIDASGHFSLQGVPSGDVQLQITVNGTTATLVISGVADHEQIHLTIQVSGTTATADDSDRETNDNGVEVEGRITAINGNTLTVAGKMITVPTGTPIHHGGTAIPFASLVVGERIHVHGTKAGSGVTASDIQVQTDNPGNPGPPPGDDHGGQNNEVELSGAVAGRSGTCPSLTFTVGTTSVSTNSSTMFEDTTCATLANGDTVEVQGTKQTNGSVLASSVDKKGR